jgi:hypothetical protein
VPAPIPKIEFADDADALSIRREHDEGYPGDAFHGHGMRAEFVIKPQLIAFAQKEKVVIGKHRRKPVRVFEFDFRVAEARAQPIAAFAVQFAGKQPGLVDAGEFVFAALGDGNNAAGVRQKNAHDGFLVFDVRPEIDKRIGVTAVENRTGGGWKCHGLMTPRCSRIRNVASNGICTQAGRLVSSYSTS